jgi:hypothetical protein
MTATNKRLLISESHGDSNRCTPYRGKSNQHATHFPRSVRVWSKIIRISCGRHIATFRTVVNRFEQIHCSREEGLPTQPLTQLSDPWVRTQLLSRTHHKHQHVTSTFNTCSRGPTHRSLTDSSGGYSLEGASFPRTTPRPSQPAVFTFHLRAPPGLQFNHDLLNQSFEFKDPMAATWSFNHSIIYRSLHLRLTIANDLSLAIRVTRIDQKLS